MSERSQFGTGGVTSSLQVCTNGGLILIAETLVHILIHEGGFADPSARRKEVVG